jgi:hypothetical protein
MTLFEDGRTPVNAARSEGPAADPAIVRAAEAIWVAAQRKVWSSLVIVPAQPDLVTGPIAQAVAAVGSAQRGEPVESLDLEGLALADSRAQAEKLADGARPCRYVAAIDCPLDSPTALLLSSSATAAVLVVERDRTTLAAAERILELVGSARFVGAVVLTRAR